MLLHEALELHPDFTEHKFDNIDEERAYLQRVADAADALYAKYKSEVIRYTRTWETSLNRPPLATFSSPRTWLTQHRWIGLSNQNNDYPLGTTDVIEMTIPGRRYNASIFLPNTEEGRVNGKRLVKMYVGKDRAKRMGSNARRALTRLDRKQGITLRAEKVHKRGRGLVSR